MSKKETKYQALNRIGEKWPSTPEGNEALIESLILEAWYPIQSICKSTFGSYSMTIREEAAADVISSLRKYDPSKKQLGGYILDRVNWALKNYYNDTQEAKASKNGKQLISIEAPSANDSTTTIGGTIEDPAPPPPKRAEIMDDYCNSISSMIAIVINYKEMECRGGKVQKTSLQNRLCFTEQITCTIQSGASIRYLNQADILYALHHEYIDYFSENGSCITSLCDLGFLHLKKKKEFIKNAAADKHLDFDKDGWLPNKVPKGFLNSLGVKTSDSQVSAMRNNYMDNLQSILKERYHYSDSDFSRSYKKVEVVN